MDDGSHIHGATLYRDANCNGVLDTASDPLVAGPLLFMGDEGSVAFQALSRTIPAGGRIYWLLAVDLSPGVPPGRPRLALGRPD